MLSGLTLASQAQLLLCSQLLVSLGLASIAVSGGLVAAAGAHAVADEDASSVRVPRTAENANFDVDVGVDVRADGTVEVELAGVAAPDFSGAAAPSQKAHEGVVSRRKLHPGPRQTPLTAEALGVADKPLTAHVWTIPPHGHYQTIVDIAIGLAARGHNVSFVACEQTRAAYETDGLPRRGIGFVSAGACPVYAQVRRAVRNSIFVWILQLAALGSRRAPLRICACR